MLVFLLCFSIYYIASSSNIHLAHLVSLTSIISIAADCEQATLTTIIIWHVLMLLCLLKYVRSWDARLLE